MAQNKHQLTASKKVVAWLAHNELSISWLAERTKADPGTVGDFLNGTRWPKVGTQGRFEKALGWPAGSIHQMAQGEAVEVPMTFPGSTVGGDSQGDSYVKREPRTADEEVEDAATDNAVLNAIQQMQRDLQAMEDRLREGVRDDIEGVRRDVAGLSERVAKLEQSGS